MQYRVIIFSLISGQDNYGENTVRDYYNIEEGDTGEELLAVVGNLYNQQSRIKSLELRLDEEDKLTLYVTVTKTWNSLTFSKKAGRRKLTKLNELLVLRDRIFHASSSPHTAQWLSYDGFISYLYTHTGKPVHGLRNE